MDMEEFCNTFVGIDVKRKPKQFDMSDDIKQFTKQVQSCRDGKGRCF